MNAATARRNGSTPSEAAIAACRSLVGNAVKGDPDAAGELARIPAEAWPDTTMRETARLIVELTADGTALELPILMHRLAVGGKVSTGDVSELTTVSPIYDAAAVADIIRTDFQEHQTRHLADLHRRGAITARDLREALDAPGAALAPSREPVNVSAWLEGDPAPITYLYDSMIARRSLVLLTGMGGLGKSGVLLAIVTSGCIGRPLLPAFRPASRLRVLWLCSEDDSDEVWRRWARLSDAYGLSDEDRETFAENLRLYCNPGIPLMDATGRTTDAFKWLRLEVDSFKPDLICIDPLAHFHLLDENANAEMGVFMSRLRDLSKPHGAAVLAVHHVAKTRQGDAESAAARGASSIRDGARAMFSLVPLGEKEVTDYGISNPRLFARLEHSKASWTPLSDRAVFLRNQDGVWFEVDLTGQRDEARRDILGRMARRIGELLATDSEGTYTRRDIAKQPCGAWIRERLESEFGTNANRTTYFEAVDHGVKTGVLFEEEIKQKGRPRSVITGLSETLADKRTEADSGDLSEIPNP